MSRGMRFHTQSTAVSNSNS